MYPVVLFKDSDTFDDYIRSTHY